MRPTLAFTNFSESLRPLQIRVSKSQMWRAHPLGKLALNPLGRLPLVLDVLVLAQAVAPASRCDSDTSFFEALELNSDSNTNSDPNTGVNSNSDANSGTNSDSNSNSDSDSNSGSNSFHF